MCAQAQLTPFQTSPKLTVSQAGTLPWVDLSLPMKVVLLQVKAPGRVPGLAGPGQRGSRGCYASRPLVCDGFLLLPALHWQVVDQITCIGDIDCAAKRARVQGYSLVKRTGIFQKGYGDPGYSSLDTGRGRLYRGRSEFSM